MTEYLAPGVYVEETSFRSKSIEGVSTSTTGFVGIARFGPEATSADDPTQHAPELLTSVSDFERIYGSLDDLTTSANAKVNYLAHAVRAYFTEGGSRLYLVRVKAGGASARSSAIAAGTASLKFGARYPGSGGNGSVRVDLVRRQATLRTLLKSPAGTVIRAQVGAPSPATPARIVGNALPVGAESVSLRAGSSVSLRVDGGAPQTVAFLGARTELTGQYVPMDPVTLPTATTVKVTLNGGAEQAVEVAAGASTLQAIGMQLNRALRGGYVGIESDPGTPANGRLVIGSDLAGSRSKVEVSGDALLGLSAGMSQSAVAASNNVGDLEHVTAAELAALFAPVGVTASRANDAWVLETTGTGATRTLEITGETGGALASLGLATGTGSNGTDGNNARYYLRQGDGSWKTASGTALAVATPADPQDPVYNKPVQDSEFVSLTVTATDGDGRSVVYTDVSAAPQHPRFVGSVLSAVASSRGEDLTRRYALGVDSAGTLGAIPSAVTFQEVLLALVPNGAWGAFSVEGGTDGGVPSPGEYEKALGALAGVDDVSIVAAPGSAAYDEGTARAVRNLLISHADARRSYRIAVLETPRSQTPGDARAWRSEIDSTHAALYYPWVVVPNPLARGDAADVPREIVLPPTGFVSGIYARNDIERAVFKSPANEVVRSALRFEREVAFGEQEMLNPLGVNCLRFFPGRGYRVWGARTASSDPEWKYVSVRRYFNYLERSIDVGTQWAVFEPNGERLWRNVRETLSSFLYSEWRSGALLGESQKEAFFVRCDRTTMDQNDLDNGRLVCLVGVAVVKPAEFVIFRVGQKTADARS